MPAPKTKINRRQRIARDAEIGNQTLRRRDDHLLLAWIEQDRRARLLVDGDLRILWMNEAARTDIEAFPELSNRGNFLALSDGDAHAKLVALVRSCEFDVQRSICIAREEDGHVIFRAQRITGSGSGDTIGMFFFHSATAATVINSLVLQAFQLTPTEHRVLLGLAEGMAADAVAEKLKISLDTARSHIRHIYQKLSVNSREEMFRRIRPYLFSA